MSSPIGLKTMTVELILDLSMSLTAIVVLLSSNALEILKEPAIGRDVTIVGQPQKRTIEGNTDLVETPTGL